LRLRWVIKSIQETIPNKERELITMAMNENRNIEIEKRNVEERRDSSMVASTFIKYAAYVVILFVVLFFLVRYVFPMF
jgi:hypothetical protein